MTVDKFGRHLHKKYLDDFHGDRDSTSNISPSSNTNFSSNSLTNIENTLKNLYQFFSVQILLGPGKSKNHLLQLHGGDIYEYEIVFEQCELIQIISVGTTYTNVHPTLLYFVIGKKLTNRSTKSLQKGDKLSFSSSIPYQYSILTTLIFKIPLNSQ